MKPDRFKAKPNLDPEWDSTEQWDKWDVEEDLSFSSIIGFFFITAFILFIMGFLMFI
jgi:hypothetical protein